VCVINRLLDYPHEYAVRQHWLKRKDLFSTFSQIPYPHSLSERRYKKMRCTAHSWRGWQWCRVYSRKAWQWCMVYVWQSWQNCYLTYLIFVPLNILHVLPPRVGIWTHLFSCKTFPVLFCTCIYISSDDRVLTVACAWFCCQYRKQIVEFMHLNVPLVTQIMYCTIAYNVFKTFKKKLVYEVELQISI